MPEAESTRPRNLREEAVVAIDASDYPRAAACALAAIAGDVRDIRDRLRAAERRAGR